MTSPRTGVAFVRRCPRLFGFEPGNVSCSELLARVVKDAEWAGSRVTVEVRGRLTIVFGDPDWIADDVVFHHLASGARGEVRAPVFLTALAAAVATRQRGGDVCVIAGSWTPDELAVVAERAVDHERVVAFTC